MKTKKWLTLVSLICLSLVLILSGCSQPAATSSAPPSSAPQTSTSAPTSAVPKPSTSAPSSTAPQAAKTLKLGVTGPLNIDAGLQMHYWMDMLADNLNKAGGLVVKGQQYNVQIVFYDDNMTAEGGRTAAEKLINQDGVKFMLQGFSGPIRGAIPLVEANKVMLLSGGTGDDINDPKLNYVYRTSDLNVWTSYIPMAAEYFTSLGYKTFACVATDNDSGHSINAAYSAIYKKYGYTSLGEVYFPSNATDYTPYATKVTAMKPDFIMGASIAGGAQITLFLQALKQLGWNKPGQYDHLSDSWADTVGKLGPQTVEGSVAQQWDPTDVNPDPAMQALLKQYRSLHGDVGSAGIPWIHGWFFFVEAIKKANSVEIPDVINAMKGLKVNILEGSAIMLPRPDLKNDRYVDAAGSNAIGIMKGGKLVPYKSAGPEDTFNYIVKLNGWENYYKDLYPMKVSK